MFYVLMKQVSLANQNARNIWIKQGAINNNIQSRTQGFRSRLDEGSGYKIEPYIREYRGRTGLSRVFGALAYVF